MDYRGHAHHELRDRRIAEAIAVHSAPLARVRNGQRARRAAGLVGIAGAASLPLTMLVSWALDREERTPTDLLAPVLLAALVLVPVAYAVTARARIGLEPTETHLERFRGDVAATRDRQVRSTAPLLMAAALLCPLGIQALVGIPVLGLRMYGAWIAGAGGITVLGHLLLAFGGWRAVTHFAAPPVLPFRSAPNAWWELAWATLAASLPMAVYALWSGELGLTLLATIAVALITYLTGGLFWPYLHATARTTIQADTAALRAIDEALDAIDTAVRIEDVEGEHLEDDAVERRASLSGRA